MLYRNCGLGSFLIKQVLDMTKGKYRKAVGVVIKESRAWIDKLGFKELLPTTQKNKKILHCLKQIRNDYPRYVDFIEKDL